MNQGNDVVTVRLAGADLELLRAGEARGRAAGLRHAADALTGAIGTWRAEAERQAPDRAAEMAAFVASFEAIFAALRGQAEAGDGDGRAALARAMAAGAGKPRARSLRSAAARAIMVLAKAVEGS